MTEPTPRTRPRRRSAALEMQQRAFVQLTIAAVVFFVIVVAAAFLFVAPLRGPGIRGVAPVLGAFMEAGRTQDVLAGHALLSVRGLRQHSRDDIADLFAQRQLFEGYRRLKVTSFTMEHSDEDPFVTTTAKVVAIAYYSDGPPAQVEADLDYDDTDWRIRRIRVIRAQEGQ